MKILPSVSSWLRSEHKFVHPRRLDVHIYQEPSFLGVLLADLEDSLDVLFSTVAAQR
jgi:hypothetical protein